MNTLNTSTGKVVSMFVLAGGVILGSLTGQALAGDEKFYTASYCKPHDGNQAAKFARYSGVIWNYDTKRSLKVDCPVTRDNTTNARGLKRWGVAGRNSKPGSHFSCSMESREFKTGRILAKARARLAYSSSTRARRADVRNGPKRSLSRGRSYYVLSCEIPPKNASNGSVSFLTSYYVEEP